MIDATRRWFRRNRTNIGVGVGILGAGYLAGQYVVGKIGEARERMTSDRVAKENLRRRFQQNQEDCTFTVLGLLPTVAEDILEELPVENLTHELQQQRAEKLGRSGASSEIAPSDLSSTTSPPRNDDGKSVASSQGDGFLHTSQMASSTAESDPPTAAAAAAAPQPKRSKAQLWNELKISSITRAFTMIYTLSLLNLLTRIQLNLIGRRNYLLSVASQASQTRDSAISLENHEDMHDPGAAYNDFELNRKFLTFSWWLLHRGWRDIMSEVNEAVTEVFTDISPRDEVTFSRMSELVVATRKAVEGQTDEERRSRKWLKYILPPREQEDFVLHESGVLVAKDPSLQSTASLPSAPADPLRRLLDETADLIDSPAATHIATLLLDAQFSQLSDVALREQAFKMAPSQPDPAAPRVQEVAAADEGEARARLAAVLAVFARQAHAIGNGVPNAYVQAMEDVRQLDAFAAVVYSSNFDVEAATAERVAEEAAEPPAAQLREQLGAEASGGALWGLFEGVWQKTVGRR